MFKSRTNANSVEYNIVDNPLNLSLEDQEMFLISEYPFGDHVEDAELREHLRKIIINGMKKMNPIKYNNLNIEAEHRKMDILSSPIRQECYEQFYDENTGFMAAVGRDSKGNYIVRFDWYSYIRNANGELRRVIYGPKDALNTAQGTNYDANYMASFLVNELTQIAHNQNPFRKVIGIGTSRGGQIVIFASIASAIIMDKIILQTPMMASFRQIEFAHQMRNFLTNQPDSLEINQKRIIEIKERTMSLRSKNIDLLVDWTKLFRNKFINRQRIISQEIVLDTGRYSSGHLNWDSHIEKYAKKITKARVNNINQL